MKLKLGVITLAAFGLVLAHPGTAHGQGPREEVYLFRVPIHLTQLDPDLAVIILSCSSSPNSYQGPNVSLHPSYRALHELKVSNARLDTTVVVRLQTQVLARDVGTQGTYTCELFGRHARGPAGSQNPLGPTEPSVVFRLTPALAAITRTFTW